MAFIFFGVLYEWSISFSKFSTQAPYLKGQKPVTGDWLQYRRIDKLVGYSERSDFYMGTRDKEIPASAYSFTTLYLTKFNPAAD
jgi:hypothetical protein